MANSPNNNDMRALADQFRKRSGMNHAFSKGDGDYLVYLLQQGLYHNGYNLHLNSKYDDATQAAVRAYQRDHGFVENGIAGPDMLNMLFPADPPAATRPAPPIPPAAITPLPAPAPKPMPVPSRPNPNPPKPTEYTIRLSARNPEAVIRVRYDR